jgi:ATP-binding cassette subfamily G (WHITE) protein 2 (SNQ2)
MCGLEEYGNAAVGSLGIEYRKRTTIGVELAAKVDWGCVSKEIC